MTSVVRVARRWQEAERVVGFELASLDGQDLPAFDAGAHIDVHLPSGLVRQYSLYTRTGPRSRYRIAVLRELESRGGSRELCDTVKVGDVLKISEPRNNFPLGPAEHTVLLAGGIGITPILCMAESLAVTSADFELHYCARTAASMAFRSRMADADLSPRTSLHFDDGDAAQLLDLARVLGPARPGRHAYVCGPAGFLGFVRKTAHDRGWAPTNVHFEYFAPPSEGPEGGSSTFDVVLARSGLTVRVGEDESIVEALARHGVDVPVSCEQGVCGTCLTRVISGQVDHRDYVLDDAEREAGDRMLPCCSRSLGPTIVLDL